MAIEHRKDRRLPFRAYWTNPATEKKESKSFLTEAEAKKYDDLMRYRIKHEPESFKHISDQVTTQALTVESCLYLYLKDRDLTPANMHETLLHARPVIAEIGTVRVDRLCHDDMHRVVSALKAAGNKQNTINRRVSIIKSALNWAEDNGTIKANPVARFRCPRGEDTRIAPPTMNEVEAILYVAHERVRRMIVLGLALGVRVGESEMFGLKWADFDLRRGTVRVWAADKNKKRPWRDLHLQASIIPILKQWREDGCEHVFHNRGKPVKTLKRAWHNALDRAGISRRIRPYDLRHAFATNTLDAGADPKAVATVMGHADMSMIHKHYQHLLERHRKAVMDAAPLPVLGMSPGDVLGAIRGCFAPSTAKNTKQ